MKASPEPSPRKNQLSPNPGALPRTPLATKSNSPPAQRSDLLRKKVNALTAIGKLQVQQSDGSSVRGRNNVAAAAPMSPGISKQAQERQPQRSDGASVRSRSSSTIGAAPKKSIRSTSMEPVKRPTPGVKRNEASRFKAQTNPKLTAAYLAKKSPRASEGAASATATAGSHISQDFDNVSEISVHHAMSEDSDADDARSVTSVASEPASRFTNRLHSPRTSTGSKLGRGVAPLWNSAHGKKKSQEEINAPEGKDSDRSIAAQSEEKLISLEDDTAFNLVGDAHELEINSFLNADTVTEPEEIKGSHQVQELEQVGTPEISTAGCQEKDVIESEESCVREQDASTSDNVEATPRPAGHPESAHCENLMDIRESAPVEEISAGVHSPGAEDKNSVPQSIEVSHLEESPATFSKAEETICETMQSTTQKDTLLSRNNSEKQSQGLVLTSKEEDEGDKWTDSTPNFHDEDGGVISAASAGANAELLSDERFPSHQEEAPASSSNDFPSSGITSTAESDEREHSVLDTAPLPHPDMERSPITPVSVDLNSHSTPTADGTDDSGEQDRGLKLRLPCDELQQDFEIKLRRDYNKVRALMIVQPLCGARWNW